MTRTCYAPGATVPAIGAPCKPLPGLGATLPGGSDQVAGFGATGSGPPGPEPGSTPARSANTASISSSRLPFVSGTSFQQNQRVRIPIAA